MFDDRPEELFGVLVYGTGRGDDSAAAAEILRNYSFEGETAQEKFTNWVNLGATMPGTRGTHFLVTQNGKPVSSVSFDLPTRKGTMVVCHKYGFAEPQDGQEGDRGAVRAFTRAFERMKRYTMKVRLEKNDRVTSDHLAAAAKNALMEIYKLVDDEHSNFHTFLVRDPAPDQESEDVANPI